MDFERTLNVPTVRKAADPDSVHDQWLDGVSKKDIKKAAEAHEKREEEARQKRKDADAVLLSDMLRTLILQVGYYIPTG